MVSLYREIAREFAENEIPDAEFDARCIIEQVSGKKLEMTDTLTTAQESLVRDMARRRITGEPLQYILGEWEFFGMRLFVGKGVLIPRPDTERLVEIVLERCKGMERPRILDLCTGSGCIALALQKQLPGAEVHGMDISPAALVYARQNASYHRLPVRFHEGNALLNTIEGAFDVIVSNPPYLTDEEMQHLQTEIQHEPALALAAGEDGLQFYRAMTRLWRHALRSGGLLAYETGEQQGSAVSRILAENGFTEITVQQDWAGRDRVVSGILPNVP